MNASLKVVSAVLAVTIAAGGFLCAAQNGSPETKHDPSHDNKLRRSMPSPSGEDRGERVFLEHCSRCHNAPESISPRIAGTVVRHMRMRANLTAEEERAVLHYFNP